jgi:hypothetical protein
MTSEYSAIYTDDSNDDDMIALAAVFREQIYYLRLPSASSIFNAECHGSNFMQKVTELVKGDFGFL